MRGRSAGIVGNEVMPHYSSLLKHPPNLARFVKRRLPFGHEFDAVDSSGKSAVLLPRGELRRRILVTWRISMSMQVEPFSEILEIAKRSGDSGEITERSSVSFSTCARSVRLKANQVSGQACCSQVFRQDWPGSRGRTGCHIHSTAHPRKSFVHARQIPAQRIWGL